MSHLTYAKIEGLLGRKRPLKMTFNRNLNVIFGVNGAGKTTLLQILDAAMVGAPIQRDQAFFERVEVGIFSESLQREIVRVCQVDEKRQLPRDEELRLKLHQGFLLSEDEMDALSRHKGIFHWRSIGDKKDKENTHWNHTYLPITRLFGPISAVTNRSERSSRTDEQLIYEMFEEGLNRTWLEFHNRLLSKIQKTQQEGLANVFQEVFMSSRNTRRPDYDVREDDPALYSMVKRFLNRQGSNIRLGDEDAFLERLSNPLLRRVSSRIYDVERQIEGFSQPIELLKSEIEKLFHGGKRISFESGKIIISSKEGSHIKLSKLSSGEKNLLKILIELFKIEQSTLLIDEPELSMHIDWQRDLLRLFNRLNPFAQLILATHSPEILSCASPDEIIEI